MSKARETLEALRAALADTSPHQPAEIRWTYDDGWTIVLDTYDLRAIYAPSEVGHDERGPHVDIHGVRIEADQL